MLTFENQLDREINRFNLKSKHHKKCTLPLKLVPLSTVSDLFLLEVVQNANYAKFMYYSVLEFENVFVQKHPHPQPCGKWFEDKISLIMIFSGGSSIS